jgi:sugar phosphate isomerase/epimerase
MTAERLVDKAVELDVECVQICYRPALQDFTGRDLEELRRHADAKNKKLEIGTSGSDVGLLQKFAEIATQIGATMVRTIFPGASEDLVDERSSVEQALPSFEKYDVVLAIENHEAYSSESLARMIGDIGSSHLRVCLDTVNSVGRGEGVREVTELLGPFTRSLHIKDFATKRRSSGMGFEVTGASAGSGKLNVPWLLQQFSASESDLSCILEQWSDYAGSLEQSIGEQEQTARSGIAYLKRQLQNL